MALHIRAYGNREAKVGETKVEVTHFGLSAGAQAQEKLPKVIKHVRKLGHTAIIPGENAVPADSISPVDLFIVPPMDEQNKQILAHELREKEGMRMVGAVSLQHHQQAQAA